MPPRRVDAPEGLQPNHASLSWANPNMLEFVQLRLTALTAAADVDDHPDYMKLHPEAVMEVTGTSTQSLQAGADRGVPLDILNLGVRHLTGCGAQKDVDRAKELLGLLVPLTPGHPHPMRGISRNIEARANSLLASAWMDDTAIPQMALKFDTKSIARAAIFANNAAALGFVSPIVLSVASHLADLGARPAAGALDHLWEALDRSVESQKRELQAHGKKVAKRPSSYCCAAPGCGIIATKKAALLKCSGGCPAESKAHYCSKECQNGDWKRHKPACRPRKGEVVAMEDQQPGPASGPPAEPDRPLADSLVSDGKERNIVIDNPTMPGGQIVLSSTTMGPAALRDIRAAVENMDLPHS